MHVKKGDLVKIIAGRDRHHGPARILRVLTDSNRVVVEGRNLVKKHRRGNPTLGTTSQVVEEEAAIHVSNVALWSEKGSRTVRTQARWKSEAGTLYASEAEAEAAGAAKIRKVRYAPATDEVFE